MEDQFLHSEFIFNEQFDSSYLYDLYENDYQYVEEIFKTTLQQLDEDIRHIEKAFAAGDLPALKKAVHKVKPAFGFVGLLQVQQICQEYEDACTRAASTEELNPPFSTLRSALLKSVQWLRQELERLQSFNTRKI